MQVGRVGQPMAESRLERFKALIEPQLRGLHRAAFRLAGNRSDAEDLVQETCLTAWEKLPAVSATEHLDRWLLRVLTHRFIDGARRRQRGPVQSLNAACDPTSNLESPEYGPADLAEQTESECRLHDAWSKLEPTQKVLLSLRAEGFKVEIGAFPGWKNVPCTSWVNGEARLTGGETIRVSIEAFYYGSDPFSETSDDPYEEEVAIVNRTFADHHWPGGNAVGRRFTTNPDGR